MRIRTIKKYYSVEHMSEVKESLEGERRGEESYGCVVPKQTEEKN